MNKNKSLSTSRSINEDYMLFSCNDHYSSQSLLPSSSVNNILISNTSNNNLDHNHQFLQAPSPFSQFQDFALLDSFLPQNTNGHGDDNNQPITTNYDHHHPSLLPLHNPIGESHLVEPSETITTHFEDPHRSISAFQETKMEKLKKRPSTTDRHSKIRTAKGTRDRRMRLSLDVAKELFGLQDMLGFDKASKTVEWLLTQAKPEIIKIAKTLSNQFNHAGFSSGDESQSRPALGSMDTSCDLTSTRTVDDRGSNTNTTETRGNEADGRSMKGKRKMLQPRTPILKKMSKDARAEARERAKDRTKNKMMKRRSQANVVQEEAHNHHVDIVKNKKSDVNWSSFECQEEIEKLCKNDRFAVCNNFVVDKKDHILDESCDMINKLNSSFPMLNHHRSQGAATSIEQQQHQFTDLHHFLGKPRDLMYNRCRYD